MTQRLALALALLAVAVVAALLGADVLAYRHALRRGDSEYTRNPATASWHPSTVLPSDPAGRILGVGTDLAFRRAAQGFEAAVAAGSGYGLGTTEATARGEVEADLAGIARRGAGARTSAADNMLGILAFSDSQQTGPSVPAPVEQSVGDFQAAVRADPSNAAAKYNLELMLRTLVAKGTRRGSNGSVGKPSLGHRGAGGGVPGRGY